FMGKPDLYYSKTISSSDYIDLETFLYNKGFYNNIINSPSQQGLDPVLELLVQQNNGTISSSAASAQIDSYRKLDIRNDIGKYLYQPNVNQQYSVSLNGGGTNDQYYFSAGFDENSGNGSFLKRNDYRRVSIDFHNIYSMLNRHLDVSTSIYFVNSGVANN